MKANKLTTEEYNAIPVFYCTRCTSLKILNDPLFGDYCADCGCTHIEETNIEVWEKLHSKYNKQL